MPGSLRAQMDARRAAGGAYSIQEAIAVVVPLCVRLAELHAQGKTLYVHPSSLGVAAGGFVSVLEDRAQAMPTLPRDRACLAPEERKGTPGDARSSVFAVGAILYELLTGTIVGPGMRRPSDLVQGLPAALETILGKALVAEPKHRPGDLAALAQALHHVSPHASIAPPPADESHLDGDGDFEVDIRLSMIPPNERLCRGWGAPPTPRAPTTRPLPRIPAAPAIPRAAALPRISVGRALPGHGGADQRQQRRRAEPRRSHPAARRHEGGARVSNT